MANELTNRPLTIKVIGLGGAGSTAVDLMAQAGMDDVQFASVHTNLRILQQRAISNKYLIGVDRTHGFGAGGDPEFGRILAEAETEQLKELCAGAELVFLIAGLGGGTGTGIAPVLAEAAKENGALVLCLVTLPFEFEGPRRHKQAQTGLQQLRMAADAVICLPNYKVCKSIPPGMRLTDAFRMSDELLVQGLRGIWQMLTRPGLIKVDFAHLYSVVRGRHAESCFATAEAGGENRACEVVEKLLTSPLLDEGKSLAEADAVLVSVVGGPDMTISEVHKVMEKINRGADSGQITMGAAIDPSFQGKISITVVASKHGRPAKEQPEGDLKSPVSPDEIGGSFFQSQAPVRPASRFVAPPPAPTPEKTQELLQSSPRGRKNGSKWKQEMLALDIVAKGRFEKAEPTVHKGADLDVPTYIRRGIHLN